MKEGGCSVMRRIPRPVVLMILLIAIVISLAAVSDVLVDWLWFDALGFGTVFTTTVKAKLALFGVTVGIVSSALTLNGMLAVRASGPQVRRLRLVRDSSDYGDFIDVFNRSAA